MGFEGADSTTRGRIAERVLLSSVMMLRSESAPDFHSEMWRSGLNFELIDVALKCEGSLLSIISVVRIFLPGGFKGTYCSKHLRK